MTNWLRLIDRGVSGREQHGEPPLFTLEEISRRLLEALDENEVDQDKLKLMNVCFDALVFVREQALRRRRVKQNASTSP